jgi:HEAT repeat protein
MSVWMRTALGWCVALALAASAFDAGAQIFRRQPAQKPTLPEQTDAELEAQETFIKHAKAQRYADAKQVLDDMRKAAGESAQLNIRVDSTTFYNSLQDERAIAILVLLLESADPETREPAVRILGYRNATQVADDVVPLLDDPSPRVRAAAISTLGRLGVRRVIPRAKELLKSENSEEVYAAADALASFGDPALLPVLLDAYRESKQNTRSALVYAIGRFKTDEAKEALLDIVRTGQPMDVSAAVWPLTQFKDDERVVTAVLERLETIDTNAERQYGTASSLIAALGQFDDPRVYETLVGLLESKNENVAAQAAYGLGQYGDARAVPALIKALETARDYPRRQILQGLGMLGTDEAMEVLFDELKTADTSTRNQILYSIAQSKNPRVIPILVSALDDEDEGVCQNACRALCRLRVKEAVPKLIELLKHDGQYVRQAAALALGDIGDRSALEPLAAASRVEKNAYTKEWMVNAISAISRFREPVELETALANLGRGHKVLWHTTDTQDADLEWIALENEFVATFHRKLYSVRDFRDALEKAGVAGLTANVIAFAPDKVWIGTTKGLFSYTRVTRAIEQYVVAGRHFDANVTGLRVEDGSVLVTIELGEPVRFRYDPKADVWTADAD